MSAQDIHFTQFNHSPLNLNPANTGFFAGDVRVVGNYKNQWQSVPVAYNTGSLSVDGNLFPHRRHGIGVGMMTYYDQAGDSRFGSLHVAASLSYTLALDKYRHHSVAAGVQLGVVHRTFDYTQLFFDNQFNGDVFDANKNPAESFSRTQFIFLDAGLGLSYRWKLDSRRQMQIGAAIAHINTPNQNFYTNHSVTLDPRYTAHLRIQYRIAKRLDLVPELLFQKQSTKQELVAGAHLKTYLGSGSGAQVAINTGGYYRIGDAGSALVGLDYNDWQVNLTYDINGSNFTPASRYHGGVELSVIYIYASVKKLSGFKPGCPVF
jgi:type IX secretion system PorP/SprF family membrane protein